MADEAAPTIETVTPEQGADDFTAAILSDATPEVTEQSSVTDATQFATELLGDEPEKTDLEKVLDDPEKPAEEPEKPADDPEKPAETDDSEPEKPSNKTHWDNLRASRDRYKAAAEEKDAFLKEQEAKIEEFKAKAARAVELEEQIKVFEEQEKELALARVEATVEYKQNIDAPLKAIGQSAELLAKSNEGDPEAVFRMLREPDPVKQRTMLKEITSGWDEIDRLDLKKMADDARVLLDKQDAIREKAHAAAKEREEIAARTATEAKEKARKEFTVVTKDAVKSIREKLPFVALLEGETEEDRYALLAQRVSQVDFDAQTPKAKALAAASALALPKAIDTIHKKDEEIAGLKEALAKALKNKPSTTPKADEPPVAETGDFFDNVGVKRPDFGF